MKLFINRDQAKGLLGGVKFQLSARTELTKEEADLVKKYKADKEVFACQPLSWVKEVWDVIIQLFLCYFNNNPGWNADV